jgi:hypothetical protein
MSGQEIQGFGGFDLNLGKMKDAVSAAAGHTDDIGATVAFVRDHGDDLVNLVRKLPDLLASAADALSGASDDVGHAANFLTGAPNSGPGVKTVAGLASDALDICRTELGDAKKLFDAVAHAFARLPIPDGGIGERVGDAAQRFETVGAKLAEVAEQLRHLGDAVDNAGHGLAATATKLKAGGSALTRLSS